MMQDSQQRFSAEAGIAIGPILFIIAILGILAAAIAAGSGSFTAGTSSESNSTKAAALIQIGENLRTGMDRITMETGVAVNAVTINISNTTSTGDLFSPTGGGVTTPSTSLSANAPNDTWYYVWAEVPGLGSTAQEKVALLSVASGVCDQVNLKANSVVATTNYDSATLGNNVADGANLGDLTANNAWPTALSGKPIGCVANSDGKYYFYEVLYIQ